MSRRRRHCAHPGCRARAMRGLRFCWEHRTDQADQVGSTRAIAPAAVPLDDARTVNATPRSAQAASRPPVPLDKRVARELGGREPVESLTMEIEALRDILARLQREEVDPERLASSVPRIVDAVVRAIRTQRTLAAGRNDESSGKVVEILSDMGLGGKR